jgi:hypothetical protein
VVNGVPNVVNHVKGRGKRGSERGKPRYLLNKGAFLQIQSAKGGNKCALHKPKTNLFIISRNPDKLALGCNSY